MPTITITCDPLPVPRRRAAALRLTRWLRDRGVEPGHVVVHFADHQPGAVFTGGMPVEAVTKGADGLRFASVVACVGADRDDDFRAGLADEVAAALGVTDPEAFLYLEFRPTPREHVHIWRSGALRRADEPKG